MLGESRRGSGGITSPSKPKATYQRSRNATPHTMSKCTDAKEAGNVAEPDVCCPAQHDVRSCPIRDPRLKDSSTGPRTAMSPYVAVRGPASQPLSATWPATGAIAHRMLIIGNAHSQKESRRVERTKRDGG